MAAYLVQKRVFDNSMESVDKDSDDLLVEIFNKEQLNDKVIRLQSICQTEQYAPEILPFQSELVDDIKKTLEDQQEFIDNKIDAEEESEYFTITLYEMDIERVRFILMKYLRIRLQKIEQQADYLMHPKYSYLIANLSYPEQMFLTKLSNLNNNYIEDTIIHRMDAISNAADDSNGRSTNDSVGKPSSQFKLNDDRVKHAEPNLKTFVFVLIIEEIEDLEIPDLEQPQSFHPGEIMVFKYEVVQDLIKEGKAQLI